MPLRMPLPGRRDRPFTPCMTAERTDGRPGLRHATVVAPDVATRAVERHRSGESVSNVTVAPEVAAQIVALHAAEELAGQIARDLHMTPFEVARVIRAAEERTVLVEVGS